MKLSVFIGRLQPFHVGHKFAIDKMLSECDKALLILGSANCERSYRNPWTYQERVTQIRHVYGDDKLKIEPVNDYLYDDFAWTHDIKLTIAKHAIGCDVKLYGHTKQGNDYLQWFPEYEYVEIASDIGVNGTAVRRNMFLQNTLPEKAQNEGYYMQREASMFRTYPYHETLNFITADALVTCGNEILLIKRKSYPGKDSWALPGGFKNQNEDITQCVIRELHEETGIKLSDCEFDSDTYTIFSSPKRALANGGVPRTTVAFTIKLITKPEITANDDAVDCQWFKLSEVLNKLTMFSDHRDIIIKLTGAYPMPAHVNSIFKV